MTQINDDLRNMAEAIKNRQEFKIGDIVKVKDVFAPHVEGYGYLKGIITDIDKGDNHSCIVSFLGENGYLSDEIVDCGILELLEAFIPRYKIGDRVKVHQIRRFDKEDTYPTDLLGFIKEVDYSLRDFPYLISAIGPNVVWGCYYESDKLWHIGDEDIDHEATAKLNSHGNDLDMNIEVFTEYGNDPNHPWGVSVGDLVMIDGVGSSGCGIVCEIDKDARPDEDYSFSVFYLGGDKCDWDNNGEDSYDWVDTSSAIGYETKVTILRRGVVDFEAIRDIIRKTNIKKSDLSQT